MTINHLNELLGQIDQSKSREAVFEFAHALLDWMGLKPVESGKPSLLTPQTQKLADALVHAPKTVQPQLYRLTADIQNIRVRLAVLKKLKKENISQLVDNDPGLTSYQAASKGIVNIPGKTPFIPPQPYFIHFVTTGDYDKLVMIFNQGDQKRILTFRKRLSKTQHNRILDLWNNVASKPKPEITELVWKSLDIKEVNKEFYQKIKEQFDGLVGIARLQQPEAAVEEVKQFAVRLIGRYIFCWFLKEKEIIPSALLASNVLTEFKGNFFQVYLRNLFFNTLNEEVQTRSPISTGTKLDSLYQNIPYLNGGLFDWHPEDKFFDLLDLNDWLISFVKVLESFDFTVDESSSLYQQVAIDPEMLGRIFENLLASQNKETEKLANDRKAFGAFYTPREIVDYMVNESLKSYLEGALLPKHPEANMASDPAVAYGGPLFGNLPIARKSDAKVETTSATDPKIVEIQKALHKLFSPDCVDNPFDKERTILVRDALNNVKVLDPACGSGAFPMGVLLRLKELWQIIGHGHRNDYDLKGEILSKNIFGVDIMPMAVEIARLRAWLSLVLDAEHKPKDRKNNFGIAALPNLDFKFVCANSLVDSGYDDFLQKLEDSHGTESLRLLNEQIQKLEKLRDEYFDPKGDKAKKAALQKQFLETKDYIKTEFASLKKNWNLGDFLEKVDDWNPFDDGKPSSFFSPGWMFGIKHGFDVVIGNPPYVQLQKLNAAEKELYKAQKFESYHANGDIYCLFYEHGIKVLKPHGIEAFITSSQWMRAAYGASLRLFLTKQNPKTVLALGPGMFESATVDTNVLILEKATNRHTLKGAYVHEITKLDESTFEEIKPKEESPWRIQTPIQKSISAKVNSKGRPLKDWDVNVYFGIKTGYNEAFIIDQKTRDILVEEDPKNDAIIRPILKGREINSYWTEWDGSYVFCTFPALSVEISEFPSIENYLNQFRPKIDQTGIEFTNKDGQKEKTRKLTSNKWFETQDQIGFHEEFKKPKVTWKRIGSQLRFSYSEGEMYSLDSTCIATGEKVKYLTALLNSKLCQYWLFENAPQTGMGDLIISVQALEPLPVYYPSEAEEAPIESLVNQILAAKKANPKADTTALEKEIDQLVYGLYGLSYEEVKVVEKGKN